MNKLWIVSLIMLGACSCGNKDTKYKKGQILSNGHCSGPLEWEFGDAVKLGPVKCGEYTKNSMVIPKSELVGSFNKKEGITFIQ